MKIELDKPIFAAGNEKEFLNFTAGFKDGKTALISHNDLDGITSAKVTNEVLKADVLKHLNYEDLNEDLVKMLAEEKVENVVFTDLFVDAAIIREIEKFARVLVIDHHFIKEDFNSTKCLFMNAQGYCASYLCYYLFSKVANIEKFDWLVASATIADWMYFKNSNWMSAVMEKYGDKFLVLNGDIRKNGKFWDLQWNLSLAIIYYKNKLPELYKKLNENIDGNELLLKSAREVQKNIDENIDKFDSEKEEFTNGYFWLIDPSPKYSISSILSSVISSRDKSKVYIIARIEGKYMHMSARRQDKQQSMNELLQKLTEGLSDADGGGHIPAAGGHILAKDLEKFRERLAKL